jgi:hypothetical protein
MITAMGAAQGAAEGAERTGQERDAGKLSRRGGLTLGCALLCCLVALGALGPLRAAASPGWLAPATFAEESSEVAFGPYVAMDAGGDALAVWEGPSSGSQSFKPAGGGWQAPGSVAGAAVSQPCLGMSSGGEAVAIWVSALGRDRLAIVSSSRPSGGAWQTPAQLGEGHEVLRMGGCHVAIDPAGDAVAVWSLETLFEFEQVWAAYRPGGGSWQPAVELRGAINPSSAPDVAIDSRGDGAAVWIGSSFLIQGEYKPAGDGWRELGSPTEAETISKQGHTASDPHVALGPKGEAVAVWNAETIQTASRSVHGRWHKPKRLSESGMSAYFPQVAMDSHGEAVAVWELHGAGAIIQGTSKPAHHKWQAPVDLSASTQDAFYPQLAMDPAGDAAAVWERYDGTGWTVQGDVRPAGAAWQAPSDISASGEHGELLPQIAIDARGDATAVWELDAGTSFLLQGASYESVIG